jgi:hypothetical protein
MSQRKTLDCGCVEEGYTTEACRFHSDLMTLYFCLGHRGFCGACCDLPRVQQFVEKHGMQATRELVPHLAYEADQSYAGELLDALEEPEP